MAVTNKDLALAIIKFLESSVAAKTVSEEFSESIDVAIDCIADAFEVEKADANSVAAKFGGKGLLEAVNGASAGASAAGAASTSAPTKKVEIDAETKAKADALKGEGNKAMATKDFATAIAKYTDAIALDKTNVVYLSNRAAAYSSALQHEKAVTDAKAAIELDASFSKAYLRLGLAQYALGNAKDAMDAYKKGMEIEGTQPSDAMKRGYETAKKRVEEELENSISRAEPESTRDAASTESAGSGAGAGAGAGGMPDLSSMFGGGMPDLSSMMNNPQVMQAAQNLMSNPGAMEGLMNNPMLRQMAQGMGGEGGLEGLMSNPALQNMARQFMGGNQGGNNNPGN